MDKDLNTSDWCMLSGSNIPNFQYILVYSKVDCQSLTEDMNMKLVLQQLCIVHLVHMEKVDMDPMEEFAEWFQVDISRKDFQYNLENRCRWDYDFSLDILH